MHRQNRACKKTKGGLKRKLNTFFGWISGIVTLFLMVIAVYAMLSSYRERRYGTPFFLFGWKPVVVLSESMEPTYTSGDILIVRERTGAPEPDDIILFRATGFGMDTYVTHRLIGKDEGGYITKGDHNEHADPGRVQEADILGTVEYILF